MRTMKKLVYIILNDIDDQFLTTSSLKEFEQEVELTFFQDTSQLFNALEKRLPSVILVDYNLSPVPGVEILKRLKDSVKFNNIPVIVLTDSPLQQHHGLCYGNGASTVIRKPSSADMTTFKINTFFNYWLNVAETL